MFDRRKVDIRQTSQESHHEGRASSEDSLLSRGQFLKLGGAPEQ